MKIVFTGAHGVGKTALVTEIAPYCKEHVVFDGIGRWVHSHEDWSEKRKQNYLNRWVIWKNYLTPDYIASRALYDAMAYSRLLHGRDNYWRMFEWAVRHIWYDYVFYVPIEFPLEADGIRYEGEVFQKAVDKEIKLILDYHKVPYHTITGTVSERLTQIDTIMRGKYT